MILAGSDCYERNGGTHLDADGALGGGLERYPVYARRAVRSGHLKGHAVDVVADLLAQPVAQPICGPRDLQRRHIDVTGQCAWSQGFVGFPLEEVGKLWVGNQAADADLAPLQATAVRELAGTWDCGAFEALLIRREVVHGDHPAQPATAQLRPGAYGLTERCLVSCRVVQHLNYLNVAGVSKRNDVVSGAEPRMETAIFETCAEQVGESFCVSSEPGRPAGEHHVVEVHECHSARLSSIFPIEGSTTILVSISSARYRDGVATSEVLLSTTSVYPESTASAFELAASLGFDGIELMIGIDPVAADVAAVEKLANYHGVKIRSIHAPCLLVTQNIWGSDPWEKLRRSAEATVHFGGDVVVVHPPFRWQRDYGERFIDGIAELNEEYPVKFAVENMFPWRTPAGKMPAYLPGWDPTDLPYEHLTLDLSHASTARQSSTQLVRAWGDRLAHIHLTDGNGSFKDEHLLPGEGNQDAWGVVELLASNNFPGHIVLEVSTRRAKSRHEREALLAGSLVQIRQHLAAKELA